MRRVVPLVGNAFKPVFVGVFHVVDGRTVLTGRYTMARGTKAFLVASLMLSAVWTLAAASVWLGPPPHPPVWFPLAGPFIAMLLIGLVLVSKRSSRADIAWLREKVQRALSSASSE